VSGFPGSTIVVGTPVTVGPSPGALTATATVACPEGSSLLGGGGQTLSSTSAVLTALKASYPDPQTPNTWIAVGVKPTSVIGASLTVAAYAVCTS
jgi:hypothetical protein